MNNFLTDNSASGGGGGIACKVSSPLIANNTISNNTAGILGGGGFYVYGGMGEPTLMNNIFWGDSSEAGNEIKIDDGSPLINYCDIEGGWQGEGNIDADPLFRDPDGDDFHLMSIACGDPYDSPCIDVGDPSILDSLLDCAWGLGGPRSDMGAYGGGDSIEVGIPEQDGNIPTNFHLLQNYPNPFNSSTFISYQLPIHCDVKLVIYNLLGQKVSTLIDEGMPAGYHSVNWDASDYSSGIYFYKLVAGKLVFTKRMTLLK